MESKWIAAFHNSTSGSIISFVEIKSKDKFKALYEYVSIHWKN